MSTETTEKIPINHSYFLHQGKLKEADFLSISMYVVTTQGMR